MKRVLLTTPHGPYDVAWGEDMMDLLGSRLARGHGYTDMRATLPAWGLYLIAENLSHPATVLENPHWDDFLNELEKGYDVVGIQLKTVNNERCARMVEAIRRRSPQTEIVIGGYGVGALDDPPPGDVHGYAAYIREHAHHLCREEGVRFMRRLLGDDPIDRPITQYHLPHARYHLPGVRDFSLKIPAILVALGCPSACDFCNTSAFHKHQKIYVADPAQTYAFMKHHLAQVGGDVLNVVLFDEDLFLNPEYVRELGRLLRSDRKTWGIRYITFGSVRALSHFDPLELKECGVGGIWIGVESGLSPEERGGADLVAKREGKPPAVLFEELRSLGIETIGSMILGFDFHDRNNIERDIDSFVALRPMFYQIGPLTPCPGTKLYRDMTKAGRIMPHYDHTHFHLWKDGVFRLQNFVPGEMKHYFDLAHERLRTVNGPPIVQFVESNALAAERLAGAESGYLRHQAQLSRDLVAGALPILRSVGARAASPQVAERCRTIQDHAERVVGRESVGRRALGRALEMVATLRADHLDVLDRPPVVSDPDPAYFDYDGSDRAPHVRDWRRERRRNHAVPEVSTGALQRFAADAAPERAHVRIRVPLYQEDEPAGAKSRSDTGRRTAR